MFTVIDLELMIFQNVNTIVMRNSAIFMFSDSRWPHSHMRDMFC